MEKAWLAYKRNGHVEIFKTSNLFNYKNIYSFKSYPLIDVTKNIDIDTAKDLSKAKKNAMIIFFELSKLYNN